MFKHLFLSQLYLLDYVMLIEIIPVTEPFFNHANQPDCGPEMFDLFRPIKPHTANLGLVISHKAVHEKREQICQTRK
jgi:hypothetical protein